MYDRPTHSTFRSRRIKPVRPQPPRMPRYIAVGLAGFFAIVPAAAAKPTTDVEPSGTTVEPAAPSRN